MSPKLINVFFVDVFEYPEGDEPAGRHTRYPIAAEPVEPGRSPEAVAELLKVHYPHDLILWVAVPLVPGFILDADSCARWGDDLFLEV